MARPLRTERPPSSEPVMPPELARYVEHEWADDEADDASPFARDWGRPMARAVLRRDRFGHARRAWLAQHGEP